MTDEMTYLPEVAFTTDDPKSQWAAAWVRAWAKMPSIPKTHKAKIVSKKEGVAPFEYKYADLPDILDAVRPILAAEGLAVSQSVEAISDGVIGVVTLIYHSAGHSESFGPTPMPAEGDPRAIGSAITYARRYAVSAALGIASDEDTDAEGTEGRKARKPAEGEKRPQETRKPSKSDPYADHKKAGFTAIHEAYPEMGAEEVKRLAAKHWAESVEAAGDNPTVESTTAGLLTLVAKNLAAEAPFK